MPSGRLSLSFPAALFPRDPRDPLRPMGQVLRCEIAHDDRVTALPPCRITEASISGGDVDVQADSLDLGIVEDPWPFPSSPAPGASLVQESGRLASPLVVRLAIPDVALREGLAWSGDRDDALAELAAAHRLRWELQADGMLLGVPLGNPQQPERVYSGGVLVAAPRKAQRKRVSKATVVLPAQGDEPPVVVVERLTEPAYQPDVYGTVGKVEQVSSGADETTMREKALSIMLESGGQREVTIAADPTLRAGMAVRVDAVHADGAETILGRVEAHTLRHTGDHTLTITEAA